MRNHKSVRLLLRNLRRYLERKYFDPLYHDTRWGCEDAAIHFHEQTGCDFVSAQRYFWLIEDDAEWRSILKREPTIRDRFKMGYGIPIQLPR
ncbi:MAG: hypothetical protein Q7K26_01685 [bacterium]|nr:hypothetical protein [bacterium]